MEISGITVSSLKPHAQMHTHISILYTFALFDIDFSFVYCHVFSLERGFEKRANLGTTEALSQDDYLWAIPSNALEVGK